MALNPFFLQGSSNEQYLVQDLINEQLKIYGIDVQYLPRKFIRTDNILNEVQTSKFDASFVIEAYLDNYEGYSPGSDMMTKFGLRLKNEINLIISKERFEEYITPFLSGIQEGIDRNKIDEYELEVITRPKEGDLIYFPLGERLFEVKRVEHEKPFYQLGKNYVYELQCELYEYENEDIDTSIEEIDRNLGEEGYITSLILGGSVTTATATASISDGVVSQIILSNDGAFYSAIPTVTIDDPPSGNPDHKATAVAITTSIAGVRSIDSIRIIYGGSGYSIENPPLVTITGGNGVGSAATAVIANGAVNEFKVTNPGSNYFTEPVVTVVGVASTSTVAKASFNPITGEISGIQIVNSGYGYTEAPTVQISSGSTVSIGGTYLYNETVIGSLSGTIAQVKYYNSRTDLNQSNPPGDLRVSINSGQFSPGEVIVGSASSAAYILKSYDNDNYGEEYDANEEIETEADSIIDFTEINPFGEF
jgi:hypothetical protein